MRILPALLLLPALVRLDAGDWPGERTRRLDRAVEAERARQQVVGVTVAIAQGGQLRYAAGFGKADLENDVPARKETVYRLASISKPITAIAALQLAEKGKLDLDAPVQRYVPGFPQKSWTVTVRDLLGHLGGIRSYRGAELLSAVHYSNVVEPLRIFAADPLVHEPRTKYLYSTYGYNLIGAAVESAAGVRFLDYVRENIFRPAGMTTIRDDNAREIIAHRTRGYARDPDGRLIQAAMVDTSNKIPGGGLVSTVFDLVSLAQAFDSGLLLRPETMRMMLTPQRLRTGKSSPYGLGWDLSAVAGRAAISHGGSQPGTRTVLVMYPEAKMTIAVMANSEHAVPKEFVAAILRALETPAVATARR